MPQSSSENVVLSREQLREELRGIVKESVSHELDNRLVGSVSSKAPIKKAAQNYDQTITRLIKTYEDIRDPVAYEKVEYIFKSTLATTTQPLKDVTALAAAVVAMPVMALRALQSFDASNFTESFVESYKATTGQLVAHSLSLAALPCEVTRNVLKTAVTLAALLNNVLQKERDKKSGDAAPAAGQPSPEMQALLQTQIQLVAAMRELAARGQSANPTAPLASVVSFRSAGEERRSADSDPAAREDVARTAMRV